MNDDKNSQSSTSREGLGGPLAVKRAQLLEDPTVQEIAKSLDIEVEAYVEQVLFYAQNKDAEPELKITDEEDLYDAGVEPVDALEILKWIEQVADGTISLETGAGDTVDGFGAADLDRKDAILKAISATTPCHRAALQSKPGGKVYVTDDGAGAQLKDLIQKQKFQTINNRRRSLRNTRNS